MYRFFLLLTVVFLSHFGAKAQSDTVRTASGLRYVILEKGTGNQVVAGSKIKAHYTGRLTSGKVFDSSETREPIKLKAGTGQVIKGWDEMLLLMREGMAVEVFIPAALAYGSRSIPDPENPGAFLIPANSDLIFRMKVVDVK